MTTPRVLFLIHFCLTCQLLCWATLFGGHSFRTLKTFQVHACDGQELRLACPSSTVISIYLANYGPSSPPTKLCAPFNTSTSSSPALPATDPWSLSSSSPSSSSPSPGESSVGEFSSLVPNSSRAEEGTAISCSTDIVETIERICRLLRVCTLTASPESFRKAANLCPEVPKYAEVAFKCRPNAISTRIICEGEKLHLRCQKSGRIVIYNAFFGGTSGARVPACQPTTKPTKANPYKRDDQDCQVIPVTETIMRSCHGRKRCLVATNRRALGSTGGCLSSPRLRLTVQYTCAPKEVLKESDESEEITDSERDRDRDISRERDRDTNSSESPIESHENGIHAVQETRGLHDKVKVDMRSVVQPTLVPVITEHANNGSDPMSIVSTERPYLLNEPNASLVIDDKVPSTVSSASVNCSYLMPTQRVVGFTGDWVSAYMFIKRNTERLLLYLLVSILGSLLAFFLVLSCRLYSQKRRAIKRIRDEGPICSPISVLVDDEEDNREHLLDTVDSFGHSPRSPSEVTATANGHSHHLHFPSPSQTHPHPHHHYPSSGIRYATLPGHQTRDQTSDQETNMQIVVDLEEESRQMPSASGTHPRAVATSSKATNTTLYN